MGRLRMKVAKCKCKEDDRRLKEQFINSISDKAMKNEIVKESTSLKH